MIRFLWPRTHLCIILYKKHLPTISVFQKEAFSLAFFLLKRKNIAVMSGHITVCTVVGFGDFGGCPYCTPRSCPIPQPTSIAGRKASGKWVELRYKLPVSLNLSSFCLLIGLPLHDLLVALCDGIKSEPRKLRCGVITGLSSISQAHMTRQNERQNSRFQSGWRPNRSSCSALEIGWTREWSILFTLKRNLCFALTKLYHKGHIKKKKKNQQWFRKSKVATSDVTERNILVVGHMSFIGSVLL